MGNQTPSPTFALDEELWFGDDDDMEAESRAAASLAAVGARIVGAKPFPIAARRLDELTRNPSTRIEQVVSVLESDPALSVRLLRLVNSAGYGLKVRCSSVRHAAVLVGTRRLNQVATTAAILDLFDGSSSLGLELLEHATVVGSLCRYLAVHLGLPHDELFTCGFLHDIGKLMLLDAERERYAELLNEFGQAPDQMHIAERKLFGFDHAVLGAHVLKAWNIPEPVPRVIAWHHSPARALQDTVLAGMVETLRLADMLAYVLPMADARLAIELVAAGDAAQYLEISDVQLAAMWDDLRGLRERCRARSHGEPELEVMMPRSELGSLMPMASRAPLNSGAPRSRSSSSKGVRPLHEVPAHFPCSVCAKPSFGNVCGACGGQVCPEHQVGPDEWCTTCVREYARFKKSARLSSVARIGVGLLVGITLSVAVVSAARAPDARVESLLLALLMVTALWAVVLPVAHRLWRKLTFLDNRRNRTGIDALPIARPQQIPIQSIAPSQGLLTMSPPEVSLFPNSSLPDVDSAGAPGSEPSLSIAPLSMAPLSMSPSSLAPLSMSPMSTSPSSARGSRGPNSHAPASPRAAASIPASMRPVWEDPPSLMPPSIAPSMPIQIAAARRTLESCSAPAPTSLAPATSRSALPAAAVEAPAVEPSAVENEALAAREAVETPVPASSTRISTRAPKMDEEPPVEAAPVAKRPSELPLTEEAPVEAAPTAAASIAAPAVAALQPEVIPSVPPPAPLPEVAALATAPTLLDASRVMKAELPAEPEVALRAHEEPASDADSAFVSSQPSGAHPVFRLPTQPVVNTPLTRARAMACGRTVSFACTSYIGGRLPQSIAPTASGSRESA